MGGPIYKKQAAPSHRDEPFPLQGIYYRYGCTLPQKLLHEVHIVADGDSCPALSYPFYNLANVPGKGQFLLGQVPYEVLPVFCVEEGEGRLANPGYLWVVGRYLALPFRVQQVTIGLQLIGGHQVLIVDEHEGGHVEEGEVVGLSAIGELETPVDPVLGLLDLGQDQGRFYRVVKALRGEENTGAGAVDHDIPQVLARRPLRLEFGRRLGRGHPQELDTDAILLLERLGQALAGWGAPRPQDGQLPLLLGRGQDPLPLLLPGGPSLSHRSAGRRPHLLLPSPPPP